VDPEGVYVPVTGPHNAMSDQDWADAMDGYLFPRVVLPRLGTFIRPDAPERPTLADQPGEYLTDAQLRAALDEGWKLADRLLLGPPPPPPPALDIDSAVSRSTLPTPAEGPPPPVYGSAAGYLRGFTYRLFELDPHSPYLPTRPGTQLEFAISTPRHSRIRRAMGWIKRLFSRANQST
jgi:hypothetical protein